MDDVARQDLTYTFDLCLVLTRNTIYSVSRKQRMSYFLEIKYSILTNANNHLRFASFHT